MRITTAKAVFASLAIHAGLAATVAHFWTSPTHDPGSGPGCITVCILAPSPESPLLAETHEESPAPEEGLAIQEPPAEVPALTVNDPGPSAEIATITPEPPAVAIPSRVVETQQPRAGGSRALAQAAPRVRRSNTQAGTGGTSGHVADTPPRLRYRALHEVPAIPETRGRPHTVWVTLDVDERGRVKSVRIKRSSGLVQLDSAALSAVRQYRFDPALASGRAVPWTFEHAVTFAL